MYSCSFVVILIVLVIVISSYTFLILHGPDGLILLTAPHTGHVDLLIVTPRTHVSGPDPRILQTLSPTGCSSLDTPPVQDQDGGDGGPEDGAQPAAAQTHLQPSGNTQEVFM